MHDKKTLLLNNRVRGQREAGRRVVDEDYVEMERVDRELDRLFNEFWQGGAGSKVPSVKNRRKKISDL